MGVRALSVIEAEKGVDIVRKVSREVLGWVVCNLPKDLFAELLEL